MRSAAVYARISRDQGEQGLGVARQERLCRELCDDRGWQVVGVYVDNDVSATSGRRRPEFERLLTDISAPAFDIIVALDLDRLTRSHRDLLRVVDLCVEHKVKVVFQHGGFDPVTGDGMLEVEVRTSVAAEEVRKLRQRISRKALELAQAGKVGGGGTRPYGFEQDRVTVRESEADVIREVARRIVVGETVRGLCADLQHRGIATVTGTPWAPYTLRRMVMSPRVAGLRQHQGEVVGDAVWPAILDRTSWERVRRVLNDPGRDRRLIASRSYLLTGGIARCGLCDAPLVARPRDDKRRCYVCARGPGFTGCGKIRSLAEPLEELVEEAVLTALDGPALADARQRATRPVGLIDGVAAELSDVERRLDELAEEYADGNLDRRQWATARKRLEARRDALNARLTASGPSPLATLKGDVDEAWKTLNFDQRRAVIAAVLDRVVVGPAVKGRNFFDPDRVDLVWRA